MDVCERFRVPIVITSLRAPDEIVPRVHGWGGLVFHDVISVRHARRAMQAGVDGLILVCAGAGGHAGMLSPFALVQEVRRFFGGTILLAGAIATGEAVLAAQAAGADLADLVTSLAEERAGSPGDDLVTSLVTANIDGEQLTSAELASFFILLVVAGNETTRNAISHALTLLTEYPGQRELLMADLEGRMPGLQRGVDLRVGGVGELLDDLAGVGVRRRECPGGRVLVRVPLHVQRSAERHHLLECGHEGGGRGG